MARQCYGGLLWSKQFYHYIVESWLGGDKATPNPPESRKSGRNVEWKHLFNRDIISMPDKWEYPWVRARFKEYQSSKYILFCLLRVPWRYIKFKYELQMALLL